MSICRLFLKNMEKQEFIDFVEKDCSYCFDDLIKNTVHHECPYVLQCLKFLDKKSRISSTSNAVLNNYGFNRIELCLYSEPFLVSEKVINDNIDRSRSFKEIFGSLVPVKPSSDFDRLENILSKSRSRAREMYYGFALCNKWTHFFTFTVSPHLVKDRCNASEVKDCWTATRKNLQQFDPDVRILCVPERHENGVLHFHALVGFSKNIVVRNFKIQPWFPTQEKIVNGIVIKGFSTFDKKGRLVYSPSTTPYYLMPYYEYGVQKKTKLGDLLYATNFYRYGINSCAILSGDEYNYKAINYLVSYTQKGDLNIYGSKRYYRTHNLDYKVKKCITLQSSEVFRYVNDYGLQIYKKTDGVTVFRNFNVRENSGE